MDDKFRKFIEKLLKFKKRSRKEYLQMYEKELIDLINHSGGNSKKNFYM